MEKPWEKLNIIKAYTLFRKIQNYPHLQEEMRDTFLKVLEEKSIISQDELLGQAAQWQDKDGFSQDEEMGKHYRDALIDLYFSTYIKNPDDYINLVRKRDRARILARTLGTESSSLPDVYTALGEFCSIPKGEVFISPDYAEGIRVALISRFISNHLPFLGIAKKFITIRDVYSILQNTIWNHNRFGRLGGKAAGMILAQKILLPTLEKHDPELELFIDAPETWYLNSEILNSFMDRNDLYLFRTQKYKDREEINRDYKILEKHYEKATFSPEVLKDFKKLLNEIGEHPIIVRSSSYLEDSFGLAFSGKYVSVFLANQGTIKSRLKEFLEGIKKVLVSVYHSDPILYRRQHGLLDYNEQMAIIVQKVVGKQHGDYFLPITSGVMFSINSYRWNRRIKSEEGLVRIVFGLGTRAVDRVGSDYPRMIALSHPDLRPEVGASQIQKYSQKMVDVINLKKGCFETVDFLELVDRIDAADLFTTVSLVEDGEIKAPLYSGQEIHDKLMCITFENLIQKPPLIPLIQKVLRILSEAYGRPIDVEFAWDDNRLYILQCRSLSVRKDAESIVLPKSVPREERFFEVNSVLSSSTVRNIEYVVYVDPKAYNRIQSYTDKMKVASIVSSVNHALSDKRFALMGPGRWGSNDINLGVKIRYSDINNTQLLAEIAFSRDGFTPEVSYGTHFFQDLIEGDIVIIPIFPDREDNFNEAFLIGAENLLHIFVPDCDGFCDVIHIVHVPSEKKGNYLHVILDGNKQKGIGYFNRIFEG
jgi:hypothetical protein